MPCYEPPYPEDDRPPRQPTAEELRAIALRDARQDAMLGFFAAHADYVRQLISVALQAQEAVRNNRNVPALFNVPPFSFQNDLFPTEHDYGEALTEALHNNLDSERLCKIMKFLELKGATANLPSELKRWWEEHKERDRIKALNKEHRRIQKIADLYKSKEYLSSLKLFADLSISPESLVRDYRHVFSKMRINHDLGGTLIGLKDEVEGEDSLIRFAEYWIMDLANHPLKASHHTIPVPLEIRRNLISFIDRSFSDYADVVKAIPEDLHSVDLWRNISSDNIHLLRNVPAEKQHGKVFTIALTGVAYNNGNVLKLAKAEDQTEEMRLAAVTNYGNAIKHIPADQQSREVRLAAIRSDWTCVRFIPKDQIDLEMSKLIYQMDGTTACGIYIPPQFRDEIFSSKIKPKED